MAGCGELTGEAWIASAPLLSASHRRRGGQWRDHRVVIRSMLWKMQTGTPWRDLPKRCKP